MKNDIKYLVFASIISADNDELDEDTKQQIMNRFDKWGDHPNWDYILDPIPDPDRREVLIQILRENEEN